MERLELTTIAKIKMLANEGKSLKEISNIVGKPYPIVRYHAQKAEHYVEPSHDKTIANHDARMREIIESQDPETLTKQRLAHELGISPTALSVWLRETKDDTVKRYKDQVQAGIWKAVTIANLHYGEGYSYEKIAHIKHISVSTVQNQINKVKELHLEPLVIARIGIPTSLWQVEKNAAIKFDNSNKTPEDCGRFASIVARLITNKKWKSLKKLYIEHADAIECFDRIEAMGHGNWNELSKSIQTAAKIVEDIEPTLKDRNLHVV